MVQPWEASVTGADQTRMVKRADELGYDMTLVPEHFVIPSSHVDLSGPHYFHSNAAQAYLAGATSKIRIGTAITLLPLQSPIIMAKALSTIDWMSCSRDLDASTFPRFGPTPPPSFPMRWHCSQPSSL